MILKRKKIYYKNIGYHGDFIYHHIEWVRETTKCNGCLLVGDCRWFEVYGDCSFEDICKNWKSKYIINYFE